MKESTSREKVLKKVRDALVNNLPEPFPDTDMEGSVFHIPEHIFREEIFASAFKSNGGHFVFSSDIHEMAENIRALLTEKKINRLYCREGFLMDLLEAIQFPFEQDPMQLHLCDAALTACEVLVARHGCVVLSSRQQSGRRSIPAAPIHMVVASSMQIVDDIDDAMRSLETKYGEKSPSFITFVSGPSRTADIEKTLVFGAHGPAEMYLFLYDPVKAND